MPPFKDLSGQRFNRLLAMKRDPEKTNGVWFLCLCDCGNTTSVRPGSLTTGNTQSCGCLKAEQRIHELGWNHPEVRKPEQRRRYAARRAVGYVRIRSAAYHERKAERHQERREEEPEVLRKTWNKASKSYRVTHPEKVVGDNKRFREENPEYGHEWYEENKEERSRYNAAYNKAHPEVQRANTKRRRAAKLQAPQNDFTEAQWQEIQEAYGHRCAYCGKRAKGHLTEDHITPLSKGGPNTASNIVPACKSCNSRKHDGPILKPVQPMLLLFSPPKPFKTRDKSPY